MAGRPPAPEDDKKRSPPIVGLRDSDLKPAFRALQTAYIHLLQNPFYQPDNQSPMALANSTGRSAEIKNGRFIKEVKRIGSVWVPGILNI